MRRPFPIRRVGPYFGAAESAGGVVVVVVLEVAGGAAESAGGVVELMLPVAGAAESAGGVVVVVVELVVASGVVAVSVFFAQPAIIKLEAASTAPVATNAVRRRVEVMDLVSWRSAYASEPPLEEGAVRTLQTSK
jgi:hypothetical protein